MRARTVQHTQRTTSGGSDNSVALVGRRIASSGMCSHEVNLYEVLLISWTLSLKKPVDLSTVFHRQVWNQLTVVWQTALRTGRYICWSSGVRSPFFPVAFQALVPRGRHFSKECRASPGTSIETGGVTNRYAPLGSEISSFWLVRLKQFAYSFALIDGIHGVSCVMWMCCFHCCTCTWCSWPVSSNCFQMFLTWKKPARSFLVWPFYSVWNTFLCCYNSVCKASTGIKRYSSTS